MIRKAINAWDHFLFDSFDPLPAAFFRISLGSVLLVSLLSNIPNWHRNFYLDGMPGFFDSTLGPPQIHVWSILDWTRNIIPVPVFGWLAIVLAFGYLIGFRTTWCALAIQLIISGMFFRNWFISNAEDTTFRMYLFYSLFLPVGDRLSIDRWRANLTKKTTHESRALWAVRIVQIHVLLIYLISTPTKWMSDASWRSGDALYYVIINPMWSRFPWPTLFYHGFIAKSATYGSLCLEGSFPFLVWIKSLRRYLVPMMIGFHILMAVALQNITFFCLAFSCGLWLFYPVEDLEKILRGLCRIRAWVPRRLDLGYRGAEDS